MALILNDTEQVNFHTDMRAITAPFKEELKALHWIITDLEFTVLDWGDREDVHPLDHSSEVIHLSGARLSSLLDACVIQFIWGVFCGTKKKVAHLPPEQLPYADGNRAIWTQPDQFFLPESEIEIICFDGTDTVVKFREKAIEQRWNMHFAEAQIIKAVHE